MTPTKDLPLSGYVIEQVYSNHQMLRYQTPSAETPAGEISFGTDFRLGEDGRFDVRLLIKIEPSVEREELVEVALIGRFRQDSATPSVARDDFIGLQAPAILLPYVRQVIASLTANGFYGAYHLPPLNVVTLMRDVETTNVSDRTESSETPKTNHKERPTRGGPRKGRKSSK